MLKTSVCRPNPRYIIERVVTPSGLTNTPVVLSVLPALLAFSDTTTMRPSDLFQIFLKM